MQSTMVFSRSVSPTYARSLTTWPSAGRVRSVWELGSRSQETRARRHENGAGIAPEGNQELAGQSDDHDPADPSPGAVGAGLQLLAERERAFGPVADPAPRTRPEWYNGLRYWAPSQVTNGKRTANLEQPNRRALSG